MNKLIILIFFLLFLLNLNCANYNLFKIGINHRAITQVLDETTTLTNPYNYARWYIENESEFDLEVWGVPWTEPDLPPLAPILINYSDTGFQQSIDYAATQWTEALPYYAYVSSMYLTSGSGVYHNSAVNVQFGEPLTSTNVAEIRLYGDIIYTQGVESSYHLRYNDANEDFLITLNGTRSFSEIRNWIFNDGENFENPHLVPCIEVKIVITHELGHVLGLGDYGSSSNPPGSPSAMTYYYDTIHATGEIQAIDRTRLEFLYPPVPGSGDNQTLSIPKTIINYYPNPVNSIMTIKLAESKNDANYTVSIYNIKGQLVKTIPFGNQKSNLVWNLKSEENKSVASGIYFSILKENGKKIAVNKIIVLK